MWNTLNDWAFIAAVGSVLLLVYGGIIIGLDFLNKKLQKKGK